MSNTLSLLTLNTNLPKSPSHPEYFRPVSILFFLSKVLQVCAYEQLSEVTYIQNLLNPLPSGFRPSYNSVTALLKVTSDIRRGIGDTKVTVQVFVDFSNAFYTIYAGDFDDVCCFQSEC